MIGVALAIALVQPQTAADLDALCRQYDPACAVFMDRTYDELRLSGARLCDPCANHECTRDGQPVKRTPGESLGAAFERYVPNQVWFSTASAKDAAAYAIRVQMQCGGR